MNLLFVLLLIACGRCSDQCQDPDIAKFLSELTPVPSKNPKSFELNERFLKRCNVPRLSGRGDHMGLEPQTPTTVPRSSFEKFVEPLLRKSDDPISIGSPSGTEEGDEEEYDEEYDKHHHHHRIHAPRCLFDESHHDPGQNHPLLNAQVMHPYEQFMEHKEPQGDSFIMSPQRLFFFEPSDALRLTQGIVMIQAIGPLLKKGDGFEVLPCWLRTGRIVFFYRKATENFWLPVLQYGSTDDLNPFIDNSTTLSTNTPYAMSFADSAVLERAAWEVYALSIHNQWPASGSFESWKVLFAIYRLKDQDESLGHCIEISRHLNSNFATIRSNRPLEKEWLVPNRDDPSYLGSTMNTINRGWGYVGHLLGSTQPKGVIKAGSTIECFPTVFVDLKGLLNHCLLILDDGDAVDQKLLLFNELFGEFMEQIVNPPMSTNGLEDYKYNVLIGKVNEPGIEASKLPEYRVSSHVKVTDWNNSAGHGYDAKLFGIERHPLADIIPLLQHAELIKEENAAGANVLIAKAVHRMTVLITQCQQGSIPWMKPKHQVTSESITSKARKVCQRCRTKTAGALSDDQSAPVQPHEIFCTFISMTLKNRL